MIIPCDNAVNLKVVSFPIMDGSFTDCLFRNSAHTGLSGLSTNGINMASLSTNIAGLPMAVCLG